ncbi:HAD-IA family hydrolase [Cohnella zeiphila]|uniref:HAD-IA family hydrolase n=1 Tax=Cohnella zeiphila TaxID=2761120 RepID=A0A7X0SM30_9BACL|nr:HAD-IA family hydrolase [Cohnella zeiphila]MBB6732386.1 HAD-IA family hydrolase [Cohnella zeiphila]
MESRPQLVLDAAGVLIGNFPSAFWEQLAVRAGCSGHDLKKRFRSEIRRELWTGRMKESEFWSWLRACYPGVEPAWARDLLMRSLKPLPALDRLSAWSRSADVHLLSNHCREWLTPSLGSVEPILKSITISNQAGCCKPEPDIYRIVDFHCGKHRQILFVDDQAKNLEPAIRLGWRTLLADDRGLWMEEVKRFLAEGQR